MSSSGELEIFAKKVAIAAGIVAALALLWAARAVVILVFIAAVLAAGIAPAVHRVRLLWRWSFHRNLSRGVAVLIVYLPFVLAVILVVLLVVPHFVVDAREFADRIPVLIEQNVLATLERYVPVDTLRAQLRDGVGVPPARVFGLVRNAATIAASIVAVLVMVAYMLIDAARLQNLLLLACEPEVRGERRRTLNRMARRMSSWLSAQLLLSAIIGVATFFGLVMLGIPYALPLAIIAAVGELIPVLGPTIGAVPALAVALLQSRWQFWSVLAFAILLQKAENIFIVPRVMSRKVSVSPLAVFIGFLLGASILGVIGAIIAIPIVAIVQVAFEEVFVARRERRLDGARAGALGRQQD
jgi:predicted PurR-regulated permease PerM